MARITPPPSAPSGASGASWVQDVNEDGSSIASWTVAAGTWSTSGGIISQTTDSAATKLLKYNTPLAAGFGVIIEAEVRIPTSGGVNLVGLALWDGGASIAGYWSRLRDESGKVLDIGYSASLAASPSDTWAYNTWHKLRFVVVGGTMVSAYRDGTLKTSASAAPLSGVVMSYVGLYNYGKPADFRNIKAWTLTGGMPA